MALRTVSSCGCGSGCCGCCWYCCRIVVVKFCCSYPFVMSSVQLCSDCTSWGTGFLWFRGINFAVAQTWSHFSTATKGVYTTTAQVCERLLSLQFYPRVYATTFWNHWVDFVLYNPPVQKAESQYHKTQKIVPANWGPKKTFKILPSNYQVSQ